MRNSAFTFLTVSTLSLGLGAFRATAAVYNETGGQVVVEAEHFDARTTSATAHHWAVIPDESGSPDTPADAGFLNARGGKYVQSLPDTAGGGENRNADTTMPGTGNVIDYKVQINTVGQYRLYLRWGGYDGSSDSIYAEIVDLRDGITGGQADWYRYSANINGDFATAVNTTTGGTALGWNGSGAPAGSADQISGGPAGEVPALWTISEPGVYTIRLSQREDGSAVDAFILQRSNLAEPTDPGPAESALATSYIIISQQPTDTAAAPGGTATFSVAATGTAAPTIQWQRAAPGSTNFADIAGATGTNYTTGAVTTADNGTKFRAVLSITGTSVRSRAATLIVDVTPPTIVRAAGNDGFNRVTVYFSEPMDPATTTSLANYSASGGLTLSNPTLSANGASITFTTSAQTNNAPYTITVTGVKDGTGINIISPNPSSVTFHGVVLAIGGILHKYFDNVQGNTVPNLTNNARFPNSPTFITIEPRMEYPPNGGGEAGSNYGNILSGFVIPPTTGAYVFFTCSDDPSSLYLSTDANPANKKLIAVEASWSNARAWNAVDATAGIASDKRSDQFATSEWPTPNAITLTQGNKYYIEVLHTEGGGGDNVGVNWTLPGGSDPLDGDPPIAGTNLAYYYSPDGNVSITQQPQNQSVPGGSPATFTVAATGSSDFGTNLVYQWQRAPSGSTTFTDIAGATSAQYTLAFAASTDNGAQYRAQVTSLIAGLPFDYSRTASSAATLTVTADTTPPRLLSIQATVQNIRVSFNEPLDTATATAASNYKLSGTGNVTGATLASSAGQAGVVALTATGISAGQNYSLTVTNVKDLAGNTIASSTLSFDVYHIISTYDDGLVPAGSGIGGNANVKSSGSYDNSGFLELTTNLGSQQGAITYEDVLGGAVAVDKFTALFKLFIGRGSGNPADGFSFNIASDLPDPTSGATTSEEGTGTGLTVAIDTYDNGGGEAPAIGLKWGGAEFATTNLTKATLVNNQWVDVIIRVNLDGTADFYHNNVKYFDKVPIPGWTKISTPRIMLGARTGGEFEVHWVDDLKVLYNADITVAEPPTISITSPTNNARFPANSSITITVNAQAPGSSVTKVEYFANGTSIATVTTPPFSLTVPNAPTGGYYLTAKVTAANGISILSAPVKAVVGTPDVIYFVTTDPGPLTFPGDQAVYEHVLSRGYDVELARGFDVPQDGSTALGKVLILQSSSLPSGDVEYADPAGVGGQFSKFRFLTIPAIEWEASNEDAYGFQAANGASTVSQTDINIVDATSPLAAGLPAGPVTVYTSPQTVSQGTPVGAHVVATLAADATQAVIYNYDRNEIGFGGFVMPARRVFFFFQDNSPAALSANGWKLFDAAMDWALNKTTAPRPQITSSTIEAGQITIRWSNGGTLESSLSLTTPSWTTTGNSSGTFSEAVSTSGNKFYRVRQ
jgi:hypothetical protein